MKLNNKGWGMTHLLIGIGIIVAFLLVAAFFTLRLNKILEDSGISPTKDNITTTNTNTIDSTAKNYYISKSNEIITATNKYLTQEDIALERDSTIQIELDLLVNHDYLDDIKDYYTNKSCQGYALTYLDSNYIKEIKAYIKCDNYTTEGYEK